jgi:predicted nucleotidyltransferase component of viral defense system
MTTKPVKNVSASVRAKLLELSRKNGEQFNFILTRYALERLLYRLGVTNRDRFVLKGAMLFALWTTTARHRPTVDMDLLAYGPPSLDNIKSIFQTAASLAVDDGMLFVSETVQTAEIREDAFYSGIRVTMEGRLGKASIPLQIDVGFGDDVTPSPAEAEYPTLLPMPAPVLRVYPRETVIAEKFHTMVDRGLTNSRMKDFYDIWFLARNFPFEGVLLENAIRATFARRRTDLPNGLPFALSSAFAGAPAKQVQWKAFITRTSTASGALDLPAVVDQIRAFLVPVLEGLTRMTASSQKWSPETGWAPT